MARIAKELRFGGTIDQIKHNAELMLDVCDTWDDRSETWILFNDLACDVEYLFEFIREREGYNMSTRETYKLAAQGFKAAVQVLHRWADTHNWETDWTETGVAINEVAQLIQCIEGMPYEVKTEDEAKWRVNAALKACSSAIMEYANQLTDHDGTFAHFTDSDAFSYANLGYTYDGTTHYLFASDEQSNTEE